MLVQLDIEGDLRGALSDTSDIHGPIPLTREGRRSDRWVSLIFVLCNLKPVHDWHTPCPKPKFFLCSEF